ncbi:MAG: rhomboid family intramembrane serine protease [Candidatus Helarchaeota archaeon]
MSTEDKFTITSLLVIVNVSAYVISAIFSLNPIFISDDFLIYLGQYNIFVLERFYIWQLITAMFFHFDLAHLLGNMLFLLLYGYRCEDFFSPSQYLLIYLGSGFAGNLLSLFLGFNVLTAGSSGAIFGLLGAVLYAIKVREKKKFNQTLMVGFIFLIFSGIRYDVNPISHWIGFLVGILISYVLIKKIRRQHFKKMKIK